MNIEELKKQAETEIADFIAQKIAELNKNTGKEVSENSLHRTRKNDRA